jgi:ppGpp synthetase/RelA/SpoT-type nucleotidyltranferase
MIKEKEDEEVKDPREVEREWLRGQLKSFQEMEPKYKLYTAILKEILKKAVSKYAKGAMVQARPKSISGFGEKALIKKKNRYRDAINRITDLAAARVIVGTVDEVDEISNFIESHFQVDEENSFDVIKRLKTTEFGYRSVHYVIQIQEGMFPTEDIDVEVPEDIFDLKAEIQVRTVLQHGWAFFNHDRAYKGAFEIPDKWKRDFAKLAAMMEEADSSFLRIQEDLQRYESSYTSYMTDKEMRDRLDDLEIILEYDPKNVELAASVGKLAIALGYMEKARDLLSRYANSEYPPLLRDLGVAICQLHANNTDSDEYKQGQEYIESAINLDKTNVDAIASLAGTYKRMNNDEKARELYLMAYQQDPSDPYPLGNFLECEITCNPDTTILQALYPTIQNAIKRCHDQAEVGMNLPWAFYDIGKFNLLLGEKDKSLKAYSKAVQLSNASFMINTSLKSLDKLAVLKSSPLGLEWDQKLLLLGCIMKFPKDKLFDEWLNRLKKMVSKEYKQIEGPVIIVIGGCDKDIEAKIQGYESLLKYALNNFEGTLISGGTSDGISGLVGKIGKIYSDNIHSIGYIPSDLSEDENYKEIRRTEGSNFSPLEPLQYWIDLAVSNLLPTQIKVLGIGGGSLSAIEYRIALALGIPTAIIMESGGKADALLEDKVWNTSRTLIRLPDNPHPVKGFIGSDFTGLGGIRNNPKDIEKIAIAIHEDHIDSREKNDEDPSQKKWKELQENLKESNRQQADHHFEKLSRMGYRANKATDLKISPIKFTEAQIEKMAEMEHARWNGERFLDGWMWGEEKDVANKISPYLVGWSDLSENEKDWDRDTVRKIPKFFAEAKMEVIRN